MLEHHTGIDETGRTLFVQGSLVSSVVVRFMRNDIRQTALLTMITMVQYRRNELMPHEQQPPRLQPRRQLEDETSDKRVARKHVGSCALLLIIRGFVDMLTRNGDSASGRTFAHHALCLHIGRHSMSSSDDSRNKWQPSVEPGHARRNV